MSDLPILPPAAPHHWRRATAVIAGETVIVLLTLHYSPRFVAAGLLAAGTTITALAETRFRARWGKLPDLADALTTALAPATVWMCLLALAASQRPSR